MSAEHEAQRVAEREPRDQPRIYVASLSDYNAGRLHGAWLPAAQEVDDLQAGITAMLASSTEPSAEEWAIHDYEGFGPVHVSEYEQLDTVSRIATGIVEHGEPFAVWAAVVDGDVARLAEFEDAYQGQWHNPADYAQNLVDDLGIERELDRYFAGSLRPYIHVDCDALARDMQLGGDIYAQEAGDGSVYVFNAL